MLSELLNRIFCEDGVNTMGRMPDKCIDLTITSPPYDDLRVYDGYYFNFPKIAQELYRVTKIGGVVVWVVADQTVKGSETGTSFRQALFFKEVGFRLHDTMIYQKDNPPPVGGPRRYYQHFDYMFIFSKGEPKTFNPIMSVRRNIWGDKRTMRLKAMTRDKDGEFKKKIIDMTGDVKIGNIWKYVVGGGISVENGTKHPATFPESLVYDHMISWSNKGDLVYDCFMGRGTTAKVSYINDRDFIGSEVSRKYCEEAEEYLLKAGCVLKWS